MRGLVVIPTFKYSGVSPPDHFSETLKGVMSQKTLDFDVIVIDTVSDSVFCAYFQVWSVEHGIKFYHSGVHIPVFHAFNLALSKTNKNYDWVAYCSDDSVLEGENDLARIIDTFNDESLAIVSGLVNYDHCPFFYPHYTQRSVDPQIIQLGENVNLHFMVFSRYFLERYNYKYPDIFSGYGTESILTFLCEAIQKKWVTFNVACITNHKTKSAITKKKKKGVFGRGYGIYNQLRTFREVLEPGLSKGIGFETWRSHKFSPRIGEGLMLKLRELRKRGSRPDFWADFDRNCYDSNLRCKCSNELYEYITANLFVSDSEAEYLRIEC